MLNVTIKSIMLSVVILSIAMLSINMLSIMESDLMAALHNKRVRGREQRDNQNCQKDLHCQKDLLSGIVVYPNI
jgi:hypothetical protein